MKKFILLFVSVFLSFNLAWSHEGHGGHDAGAMGADTIGSHGGVVKKALHHLMLEMVKEGQKIKLYPLTHDKKPIPAKEVEIVGKVEIPRKGQKEITFKANNDYLESTVDAQGSHRFELKLVVTYKKHKHDVNFQVEPEEGNE